MYVWDEKPHCFDFTFCILVVSFHHLEFWPSDICAVCVSEAGSCMFLSSKIEEMKNDNKGESFGQTSPTSQADIDRFYEALHYMLVTLASHIFSVSCESHCWMFVTLVLQITSNDTTLTALSCRSPEKYVKLWQYNALFCFLLRALTLQRLLHISNLKTNQKLPVSFHFT